MQANKTGGYAAYTYILQAFGLKTEFKVFTSHHNPTTNRFPLAWLELRFHLAQKLAECTYAI